MKTIVVSGANRGIGFEICRQLDAQGCHVILGSRDLQKGKEAAASLSKRVIAHQLDVCDEHSIKGLFDTINARYGKIDVLINNAGLGSTYFSNQKGMATIKDKLKSNIPGLRRVVGTVAPLLKKAGLNTHKIKAANIPLHQVKTMIETNFYGPWSMIQAFIPLLQKSKDGRVINISSGMGQLNRLNGEYPAYSMSKASLNALTIMFANELQSKGIRVNAICPGWVKTDMGGPDAPRDVSEGADTAVWLSLKDDIPSGKFFRDRHEIEW